MNDKQKVAKYAVDIVKNDMVVGLGTGSTANCFIEALASRVKNEGLQITLVASSVVSMIKAKSLGLSVVSIEQIESLDLYVDGADEVSPDNTLLKGQGADLVREKLLARSAKQFIVLVDQSKMVARIGEKFSIPIEVMPFAWQMVKKCLEDKGGKGDLRSNGSGGLAVSSAGNLILDMAFESNIDSEQLNIILNGMPGVVEHGIFQGLASVVLLVENDEVKEIVAA